MKKNTIVWSVIIVIIIIGTGIAVAIRNGQVHVPEGAAAVGLNNDYDSDEGSGGEMQAQAPATTTQDQNAQLQAGASDHTPTNLTFDLTTGSYYFTPNVIHVKKGDTVTFNITNAGGVHNFQLDEFNAKTNILPVGKAISVTFVADKTGSFEFYCGIGDHRQMGQKGTLIVE